MLPISFLVAVFAGFPEIPEVGEYNRCRRQSVRIVHHGKRHLAVTFQERESHAVAIGEDHHILIGERSHFVGDEDNPPLPLPKGGVV